ncbi:MAG: hypothetical protein IBX55_00030 [Methyloprofundus sp.]|nr:hypothetical protein [Methyloprofundus sp.]
MSNQSNVYTSAADNILMGELSRDDEVIGGVVDDIPSDDFEGLVLSEENTAPDESEEFVKADNKNDDFDIDFDFSSVSVNEDEKPVDIEAEFSEKSESDKPAEDLKDSSSELKEIDTEENFDTAAIDGLSTAKPEDSNEDLIHNSFDNPVVDSKVEIVEIDEEDDGLDLSLDSYEVNTEEEAPSYIDRSQIPDPSEMLGGKKGVPISQLKRSETSKSSKDLDSDDDLNEEVEESINQGQDWEERAVNEDVAKVEEEKSSTQNNHDSGNASFEESNGSAQSVKPRKLKIGMKKVFIYGVAGFFVLATTINVVTGLLSGEDPTNGNASVDLLSQGGFYSQPVVPMNAGEFSSNQPVKGSTGQLGANPINTNPVKATGSNNESMARDSQAQKLDVNKDVEVVKPVDPIEPEKNVEPQLNEGKVLNLVESKVLQATKDYNSSMSQTFSKINAELSGYDQRIKILGASVEKLTNDLYEKNKVIEEQAKTIAKLSQETEVFRKANIDNLATKADLNRVIWRYGQVKDSVGLLEKKVNSALAEVAKKPIFNDWVVTGLTEHTVLLRRGNEYKTVREGQEINGVKVISVNPGSGVIKTNLGEVIYEG